MKYVLDFRILGNSKCHILISRHLLGFILGGTCHLAIFPHCTHTQVVFDLKTFIFLSHVQWQSSIKPFEKRENIPQSLISSLDGWKKIDSKSFSLLDFMATSYLDFKHTHAHNYKHRMGRKACNQTLCNKLKSSRQQRLFIWQRLCCTLLLPNCADNKW